MTMASPDQVTQLLVDWSNGDREALDQLMPLVYDELRRLAHHYMQQEPAGHTLQTTALIHELYLRLVDQRRVHWRNRAHFFAIAAQLMRRILIDHARSHTRAKRWRGGRTPSLNETPTLSVERAAELVALDNALTSLADIHPRKARVVELRFFGGLTSKETAEALNVSPRTVLRDWNLAQAWLYREMMKPVTSDQ